MGKSIFCYGDLNKLKVSFRDKLLDIGFYQVNKDSTLFIKNKGNWINDVAFTYNLKAKLITQLDNNIFRHYHGSDHSPLIYEISSRPKKTFRKVVGKEYNQEEFAFH